MSFTGGSLADGKVPVTVGAIYTASSVALLKFVSFYNTSATQQTVNVHIRRGSAGATRRQLYRFTLSQYETATINETITLSSGDRFDADTTTASAVDYVISGATSA